MGLFDYFRQSGAGVVQDIQAITRTGAVTPRTTTPRVSTTRRLPTFGEIGKRISTGYKDVESRISKRIPTLIDIQQRGAEFAEKRPEIAKAIYTPFKTLTGGVREHVPVSIGVPVGRSATGFYEHVQEKPVSTAAEVGMLYAGGAAVGAGAKVGTLAARSLLQRAAVRAGTTTLAGRGLLAGSAAVEPALGIYGGYETGKYVLAGETPEEKIKRTGEVGVGLAGAMYGFKKAQTGVDWLRVRGRTEIPKEKIVDPRVLSGEQQFPMVKRGLTPAQAIEAFKSEKTQFKFPGEEGYGGYHATAQKFGKTMLIGGEATRPSDVPGLYISPKYASTYFTRTGELQPRELARTSIIKKIFGEADPLRPQITRQSGIDVGRLPPEQRYSVSGAREFLTTKGEPGKAYLTPTLERSLRCGGAPEAEAVISPMTKIVRVGERFYVKIGDRRIPIDEYMAERQIKGSLEFIKGTKPKTTTPEELIMSPDYYRPITTRGALRHPSVISSGLYPSSRRVSETAFDNYYADLYGRQPVGRRQLDIPYRQPVGRRQLDIPYRPIEYRQPEKPSYRPETYRKDERPPYRPTTYKPPQVPPLKPPYKPPYVPPPTVISLKPEKGKPKKKIGYQDPRYWPQENPVADLWGMLGIKKK